MSITKSVLLEKLKKQNLKNMDKLVTKAEYIAAIISSGIVLSALIRR